MDNSKKKERIKILFAEYNVESDLAKLKITKIETGDNLTWALSGESLDSIINQLTNQSLIFSKEQREKLSPFLVGKTFYYVLNADMLVSDLEEIKDASLDKLQKFHDIIDQYPFYEIQQEIAGEIVENVQN
jgi:hypothetical protein